MPIFDRLYLGGSNNLRGFKFRDVGPKDSNGDPIGGQSLWRATVEVTVPVVDKVRAAVFRIRSAALVQLYNPKKPFEIWVKENGKEILTYFGFWILDNR